VIISYALKNALEHDGKSSNSSVLNACFIEGLEKSEIKEIMPLISEVVTETNAMSIDDQKKQFELVKENISARKTRKEGELPELPNAEDGKVVTRMPPEPSKYNHIGHALSFLLNYIYAKKYHGKCVLRFEDTNPEKVSQEYVDAMKTDVLDYLDIKPDSIRVVSEDMDLLIRYADELVTKGYAYVCSCAQEKLRDNRHAGLECDCRKQFNIKNLDEWRAMKEGKYKEGEVSLRLKGDMQALNQVMRDPVIFRIISTLHYILKDKYKVWPMYDFYNPIEDHLCEVTHILRSDEFAPRIELQDYLRKLFGLKQQTIMQYGRINIIGATTQGREIRELIESGDYIGWDDPRLVTLRALKKRGIVKETYYELLNHLGFQKKSPTIDFQMIASINKKFLEHVSRYYFVENPIKITISGAPQLKAKIPLHPDLEKGFREYKTDQEFYLTKTDYDEMKNGNYRLMHLLNFKVEKISPTKPVSFSFTSEATDPKVETKFIQWLPANAENVKTIIRMPDNAIINGLAEPEIKKLKVGDIIQFERFGFCRLNEINKKTVEYEFRFGHK
jgi:glutamyl-tRNA synthetase